MTYIKTASLVLFLGSFATRPARAAITSIDDFEAGVGKWTADLGMPAAKGTLTSGATGHAGKGAHLAYDFSAGGVSVGMIDTLAAPVMTPALSFWAKSAPGVTIALKVTDGMNQTFTYNVTRPLEARDPAAWYRQVVELDVPTTPTGLAPQGGVKVIELLVSPIEATVSAQPTLVGAIDFDDVGSLDVLRLDLDPMAPPDTAAAADQGDLASRLGVNIHFTVDDKALDAAKKAGFTWVRMDLTWDSVEKTAGVYDFTAYDALIASLALRGMKALLILDYGNKLHTGGTATDGTPLPPISAADLMAFGAYAQAAAMHFAGKGVMWEIWNEENGQFWKPSANVAQYIPLAKQAVTSLRAGDANAKISTGGLFQFDWKFLHAMLTGGAATGADAIGIHPYFYTPEGPELQSDGLFLLRSISGTQPVWCTEWGFSTAVYGNDNDPALSQAIRAARQLLFFWATDLPLGIYYDIRDDSTNPADIPGNYGLLANDYTEKKAIVAARTLANLASGRTLAGAYLTTPSSVHALKLTGANDVALAVWSELLGAKVPVTIAAPPTGMTATATDLLGASVALTPAGARLGFTATETPVYIVIAPAGAPAGAAMPTDGGAPPSDLAAGGMEPPKGGGGGGCTVVGGELAGALAPMLLLLALYLTRRRLARAPR